MSESRPCVLNATWRSLCVCDSVLLSRYITWLTNRAVMQGRHWRNHVGRRFVQSGNEHNLFDQLRMLYDCSREKWTHYAAIDKPISNPWAIGSVDKSQYFFERTSHSREEGHFSDLPNSEADIEYLVFGCTWECSMYWLEQFVNIKYFTIDECSDDNLSQVPKFASTSYLPTYLVSRS